MREHRLVRRVLPKLACALLLPACLTIAAVRLQAAPEPPAAPPATEFPTRWEGRPLRPLVLSDVEQRFARQFPGSIARLTDERNVIILRTVLRPTRMLHPAADCYRGLGWSVAHEQLQQDANQDLWRCFEAARDGQRLRVCERIVDAQGRGFTDASAWYWAALLEQSRGPWQAFTVARPA
jgi:hypothetical protein